ncbi:4-hydroxyphenylacetate 3-monooxygenase, reductase component [Vibrio sp. Isolate31]|uniref:4-hydroxyphenylacetate 3-monooxygenase, reductase component n=1 Tax=unclassified Vibrio TaxID=2614977 RepID=UPI001EFE6C4D|nr:MULTISPECIES: 4-hydroxyphenylacetate 3-monooxygenase, reductase component [unclassified Vibrio]MCG9553596.1 4-hydroxyphenylacetate 3-monooxygenase, reductase component [Vibrio sp. Isolate32]MCG9601973.1 4-hydroxyphenylacetate 3-monooxygenase, reductase component [Vibrio sp. Isolate31]
MSLQQEFRNAMSKLAAAVNIVTTGGQAGTVGITATAVCSVTDSPATVLVCVNRSSASNEIFKKNGRLCVNTCASEHQELSMHFAGMTSVEMAERFAFEGWKLNQYQVPVLEGSLTTLEGRISDISEVGTHSVFFVHVESITTQDKDALMYFDRQFKHLKANVKLAEVT